MFGRKPFLTDVMTTRVNPLYRAALLLIVLMGFVGVGSVFAELETTDTVGPSWERLPDMPIATAAPAVSVQGRRAVVSGGVVLGSGASVAVQVLDLDGLTWSLPTMLNTPRYQHGQITLNDGRILIVGGRTRLPAATPQATRSCELISADLAASEPTADLPVPMRSPTLHLLNDGRVAAVGMLVTAVFDPEQAAWTIAAPLRQVRREHASVMLKDGTILVGGGIGRSTFERVDLVEGKSRELRARLPIGRDDLAMVPLPDGRVWIIGGQAIDGQTTDQTWLLTLDDEKSGVKSRLEDGPALGLAGGVADHVVIQTPNGVVVVGGESQNGRHDTELADAFWLDPERLTVRRLPATQIAHDDAAGFLDGDWAVVLGGQVKAPFLGVPVPTPIRAVHRIKLPAPGR